MNLKTIGMSKPRKDAYAKVTGKADFTEDILFKNKAYGKILRATISHGYVKSLYIEEALKVPGVLKILTHEDVPKFKFPTAGHPYSIEPGHGDIEDKLILTDKIRFYGDEIAAVIAETPLQAEIAISKIKVTYEELPFYLDPKDSMKEGATEIQNGTKNILAKTQSIIGDFDSAFKHSDHVFEDHFETPIVQHCHMENQAAVAYKDFDGRWVCVTSTQIPHICRRILGQAFGMPWGQFRVIKPFIGGGFGNKQDVTIEPLTVLMSMVLGGRPVQLTLEREESLAFTRVRHAISYDIKAGISNDGKISALKIDAISNNGAYASHGHSIAAKGAGIIATLYDIDNYEYNATTVYTNTATAGAMRGYGVPQVIFAVERLVNKICTKLKINEVDFRLKNFLKEGALHPFTKIPMHTNKITECLIQACEKFQYENKLAESKKDSGTLKFGVGVAAFSYATAVYPHSLEIAGCRLSLNQDASVKLIVGATEIGQGSDTVLAQMVAEVLDIDYNNVFVCANTDTDVAPFDTGSYASRQTYVSGMAVLEASQKLKANILSAAQTFYPEYEDGDGVDTFDLDRSNIVLKKDGKIIDSLANLALKTYYDRESASCLTAESSINCHKNSFPMGVTLAHICADTETGEVTLLNIINAHDSGKIMNPILASGQVEGGMGMAIGYALGEQLKYSAQTGKILNNNLLDYKMPTTMDVCDLDTLFIESDDPFGPFGAKGLGEPPICSPAAAIANAVSNALGVPFDSLPITPQGVYEALGSLK